MLNYVKEKLAAVSEAGQPSSLVSPSRNVYRVTFSGGNGNLVINNIRDNCATIGGMERAKILFDRTVDNFVNNVEGGEFDFTKLVYEDMLATVLAARKKKKQVFCKN